MPLIYITGAPGTGKSTILRELQSRGYKAHGTDEHGYSQWIGRKTGEVVVPPEDYDLHAWYKDHEWTLNPEAIEKLRSETDKADEVVFLCGVAAGTEAVQHLFNQTIVLTANAATLKQRITDRKDNNFGKTPEELKIILEWQDRHVDTYRKQGVVIVDTAKPVNKLVDEILEKLGLS
jgi:broad-specificity NMP kinase